MLYGDGTDMQFFSDDPLGGELAPIWEDAFDDVLSHLAVEL